MYFCNIYILKYAFCLKFLECKVFLITNLLILVIMILYFRIAYRSIYIGKKQYLYIVLLTYKKFSFLILLITDYNLGLSIFLSIVYIFKYKFSVSMLIFKVAFIAYFLILSTQLLLCSNVHKIIHKGEMLCFYIVFLKYTFQNGS